MKANVEKWLRRDKKRHRGEHGMRVRGKSTLRLGAVIGSKAQAAVKKKKKSRRAS